MTIWTIFRFEILILISIARWVPLQGWSGSPPSPSFPPATANEHCYFGRLGIRHVCIGSDLRVGAGDSVRRQHGRPFRVLGARERVGLRSGQRGVLAQPTFRADARRIRYRSQCDGWLWFGLLSLLLLMNKIDPLFLVFMSSDWHGMFVGSARLLDLALYILH